MPNVLGRMISGSLWLSGARAVTNALAFVSTIVLARLLVPADFGLVALGTTVLAIITAVTEMSLAQALVHHRNPGPDHFHTAWTLGVIRGLVLAGLMSLGAGPLASFYGEPRLAPVIYALALSVFVSGFANPRQVILMKQLIFWQEFLLTVAQRLAAVVSSVVIAIIWQSYWALVAGTLIGQLVQVGLSYTILPFRPKVTWKHMRELWSFSIWLTLGQAINTINWRFDQLLVGYFLGRATLGHYTVGDNLAQMPTREATAPLRTTLFPALAPMADDPDRLRHAYQRAQALITFIALPAGIGFALIAEPLVILAMGEKWLPAVPVIQALSAIFAIQTLGSLVQPLGMAKGHTRLLFRRDLQMFFVRLPVIIAGTILWGLTGLIYSRVVTGLLAAVVNMFLVRRMTGLKVKEQVLVNARSLFATAMMLVSVVLIQSKLSAGMDAAPPDPLLQILASIIVGAGSYLGWSFLTWFVVKRPQGPETEALRIAGMLGASLMKGGFRRSSRHG